MRRDGSSTSTVGTLRLVGPIRGLEEAEHVDPPPSYDGPQVSRRSTGRRARPGRRQPRRADRRSPTRTSCRPPRPRPGGARACGSTPAPSGTTTPGRSAGAAGRHRPGRRDAARCLHDRAGKVGESVPRGEVGVHHRRTVLRRAGRVTTKGVPAKKRWVVPTGTAATARRPGRRSPPTPRRARSAGPVRS